MIGILLTVLVAVLVYLILAALMLAARRHHRRDPRADRRHPERRLRLRKPLGRQPARRISTLHARKRKGLTDPGPADAGPASFQSGWCSRRYEHAFGATEPQDLSVHPVDVGQRTEAVILAELVKRGHTVLVPYGTNHRYDLVLETREGFLRVQCKTGRLRGGVIKFNTVSVRANTRRSGHSCILRVRRTSSSSTAPTPGGSMLWTVDDGSPRRVVRCASLPRPTAKPKGSGGQRTTNCPPSSIGRALHL